MRIFYTSIYRTVIYYKIISTLSTKCLRIRSVYRRIFSRNLKITGHLIRKTLSTKLQAKLGNLHGIC